MSKSKKLREIVDEVWLKILQHPFVLELYSGTLPISKFKYYAIQDYNYLVSMTKVLSIMSVKAPDLARTKLALELAYKTITVEMANYEELLSSLGLSIDEVVKIEPNPTNIAYMNFLLTTCYTHDYWRIMSALLPCFW
ncbi:MAG: thiaminase II, partial [Nitrososphaerota archaeon]